MSAIQVEMDKYKWLTFHQVSQGRDHKPGSHRVISYLLETAEGR